MTITLVEKAQRSFALADEIGYVVYRGYAVKEDDERMFNSNEEVDTYLKEALGRLDAKLQAYRSKTN